MSESPEQTGVEKRPWRKNPFFRRVGLMLLALAGPLPPKRRDAEARGLNEPAEARQEELEDERAGLRLWRTALLILGFIAPIITWISIYSDPSVEWIGVAVFIEVFLLVSLLAARTRLLTIRAELQRVEYEALLDTLPEQEHTAANLFFKHQFELKQYYDQALRQHRQAFALGVGCVLFGLGVVVIAITSVRDGSGSGEAVIAVLGGIGALLSGTVASIYLVMYAGSTESLQTFHQRLVRTNRMYLANLLVAEITDEKTRMQALERLAEHTVTTNDEATAG